MWTKYGGCLLVMLLLLKHSLSDINNYATDAFVIGELQILYMSVCSMKNYLICLKICVSGLAVYKHVFV
jgi:hypothetical protein